LGEPLQTDTEAMTTLATAGVRPGVRIGARRVTAGVEVGVMDSGVDGDADTASADVIEVSALIASRIFVVPPS
jgi:hypothetical protein